MPKFSADFLADFSQLYNRLFLQPPKKSLEVADYVFSPPKKHKIPHFILHIRTLIVNNYYTLKLKPMHEAKYE
jgi:hypothetical protein